MAPFWQLVCALNLMEVPVCDQGPDGGRESDEWVERRGRRRGTGGGGGSAGERVNDLGGLPKE